jgi:anti-sigma B factor antagonist
MAGSWLYIPRRESSRRGQQVTLTLRRGRAGVNNVRCAAETSGLPPSKVRRRGLLTFRANKWWWYVSQERYPVLWIGQVAVVTLPAEIDVTNADTVREEFLSVLNQGAVLLIADLSKTSFCDSAGVSALVRTFRQASTSASAMRLVVSTPAVQRVLSITGVDRLVDTYPSVAASLAGQGGQGGQAQPDNATAKADTDGGA